MYCVRVMQKIAERKSFLPDDTIFEELEFSADILTQGISLFK